MDSDIIFEVIGNTSPFSLMGESSCYMVTVNGRSYLLDCGTPIFPHLGYEGIADIKGIFATHSHEDHKRWFTDIVLFTFYNPLYKHRVRLISNEMILEEYAKNSKAALERSLSPDSKRIIDIPYDEMVEPVVIGPRSRYFITFRSEGHGAFYYRVEDRAGNILGPEKAKIFINPAANRPRLLFKDEESGEWVEPESYYCLSSESFYERDRNIYRDAVVVHDVARKDSIVHTDYADIADVPVQELFFTHSPDNLTSLRPILTSHRKLVLRDGRVHEAVKGRLHPFDADVYVHHFSRDLVGYRAENGAYKVIRNNGLLGIAEADGPEKGFMNVDLFEDVKGEYYPLLKETNQSYVVREDGKVEEVTRFHDSSTGRVVQDLRGTLQAKNTK